MVDMESGHEVEIALDGDRLARGRSQAFGKARAVRRPVDEARGRQQKADKEEDTCRGCGEGANPAARKQPDQNAPSAIAISGLLPARMTASSPPICGSTRCMK